MADRLATDSALLLLRLLAALTVAFLVAAVLQRVLLGHYVLRAGPFELPGLPEDTGERAAQAAIDGRQLLAEDQAVPLPDATLDAPDEVAGDEPTAPATAAPDGNQGAATDAEERAAAGNGGKVATDITTDVASETPAGRHLERFHVEHIVPLDQGGAHRLDNLVVRSSTQNRHSSSWDAASVRLGGELLEARVNLETAVQALLGNPRGRTTTNAAAGVRILHERGVLDDATAHGLHDLLRLLNQSMHTTPSASPNLGALLAGAAELTETLTALRRSATRRFTRHIARRIELLRPDAQVGLEVPRPVGDRVARADIEVRLVNAPVLIIEVMSSFVGADSELTRVTAQLQRLRDAYSDAEPALLLVAGDAESKATATLRKHIPELGVLLWDKHAGQLEQFLNRKLPPI